MKKTTLVATLTSPPSAAGDELAALPPGVGYLEVRADLVGELDPAWLRDRFAGGLIYTLRSAEEGGAFDGGRSARRKRLGEAAAVYDLVDLEGERDLHTDLLDTVPAEKRILSWHGPGTLLSGLKDRVADLTATAARYYKLVPEAAQAGHGVRVLGLLQALGRDDVIAFASGEGGSWTRFLAPRLGSPLTYGALGDSPGAPGQPSVRQLAEDYGLPQLTPVEHLFGIVGRPVAHSLSPRLHNGAYRALDMPCLYVPFHADSFGDFWIEVVESGSLGELGLPLQGLSVTAPYKEVALAVSGASSPRAQHVGAANTLVLNGEVWEAETTDPEGVLHALDHHGVELAGRRAAVVGCGGAGKAAAYGLVLAEAEVTLVNRHVERGKKAAIELGLPFLPLADFDPADFDVLVHATPLGRAPDDPLPFLLERVPADGVVVDLVYADGPTPLVSAAAEREVRAIDGREVLLYQALGQFRLMTLRELDEAVARRLLGLVEEAP